MEDSLVGAVVKKGKAAKLIRTISNADPKVAKFPKDRIAAARKK